MHCIPPFSVLLHTRLSACTHPSLPCLENPLHLPCSVPPQHTPPLNPVHSSINTIPSLAVAQVVSSQFTKSVIRSRAALTYAEAQSRIDDARLTDELSVSSQPSGAARLHGPPFTRRQRAPRFDPSLP